VLVVAFDLGRAALVALDHDADGVAAVLANRSVVVRDAREHVLRRLRVRHDLLDGAARAALGGERGARASEEHEAAASDGGVGRVDRLFLKGLSATKPDKGGVGGSGASRYLGFGALLDVLGAVLVRETLPEDLRAVLRFGEDVRFTAAHR
jgi:hypothetical protein